MTKQAVLEKQRSSGRWKLLLVLLVCASPLMLSYLTYYVIKPTGRTNYGALIDPRRHPIPATLDLRTLDGQPVSLERYRGKWVMLQSGPSACPPACQQRLYAMRQLRLMQGREMERIERVWLITDGQPLDTLLIREFDGTDMLRVAPAALAAWLPLDAGEAGSADQAVANIDQHLYLIDPMGHLMMRFPKDANPAKVKNDINKLLKASAIG